MEESKTYKPNKYSKFFSSILKYKIFSSLTGNLTSFNNIKDKLLKMNSPFISKDNKKADKNKLSNRNCSFQVNHKLYPSGSIVPSQLTHKGQPKDNNNNRDFKQNNLYHGIDTVIKSKNFIKVLSNSMKKTIKRDYKKSSVSKSNIKPVSKPIVTKKIELPSSFSPIKQKGVIGKKLSPIRNAHCSSKTNTEITRKFYYSDSDSSFSDIPLKHIPDIRSTINQQKFTRKPPKSKSPHNNFFMKQVKKAIHMSPVNSKLHSQPDKLIKGSFNKVSNEGQTSSIRVRKYLPRRLDQESIATSNSYKSSYSNRYNKMHRASSTQTDKDSDTTSFNSKPLYQRGCLKNDDYIIKKSSGYGNYKESSFNRHSNIISVSASVNNLRKKQEMLIYNYLNAQAKSSRGSNLKILSGPGRLSSRSPGRIADMNDSCKTFKRQPLYPAPTSKPDKIIDSFTSIGQYTELKRSTTNSRNEQKLQDFKNLVNYAKLQKKTFTVVGNFNIIRRALIARGWIEKVRIKVSEDYENFRRLEHLSCLELIDGLTNKDFAEKYRRALISKLLHTHQVDFYWDSYTNPFTVNSDKIKPTIINRYPIRPYGSKGVLCDCLNNNSHWFCIEGKSNVLYPRTYNLTNDIEKREFIKDFQLTATISLISWIATKSENEITQIISHTGHIPVSIFSFALRQCQNYIKSRQHKDIDDPPPDVKEFDWVLFLDNFYKIAYEYQHFKKIGKFTKDLLAQESKLLIKKLEMFWPNIKTDGFSNLWIMKPHSGSQGCGIVLCRKLKDILNILETNKNKKYVVQKYIERPLLIYKTKFDIRQWFLIAHQPNLHVWMYKECYLRFSSQEFDLSRLHEAIHLTNNSVQSKYKNCHRTSPIPEYNMWHSDTFKRYLIENNLPSIWSKIYKRMKECIIGVIMCCEENMSNRVNSFELWGTDFVLSENYNPYILEINPRPALYASTVITGRMCPQVLEDVVKVTVDYARDRKSPTGNFELIYEDDSFFDSTKIDINLSICGINYFTKYKKVPKRKARKRSRSCRRRSTSPNKSEVKVDVRKTLTKLLSLTQVEREDIDPDSETYKEDQFKFLLSEFANIISPTGFSPNRRSN